MGKRSRRAPATGRAPQLDRPQPLRGGCLGDRDPAGHRLDSGWVLTEGDTGGRLVVAGMAPVALSALEVGFREHVAGFASQSLFLSGVTTLVLHGVLAVISADTAREPWTLAVDAALFAWLFSVLARVYRTRCRDALDAAGAGG